MQVQHKPLASAGTAHAPLRRREADARHGWAEEDEVSVWATRARRYGTRSLIIRFAPAPAPGLVLIFAVCGLCGLCLLPTGKCLGTSAHAGGQHAGSSQGMSRHAARQRVLRTHAHAQQRASAYRLGARACSR